MDQEPRNGRSGKAERDSTENAESRPTSSICNTTTFTQQSKEDDNRGNAINDSLNIPIDCQRDWDSKREYAGGNAQFSLFIQVVVDHLVDALPEPRVKTRSPL